MNRPYSVKETYFCAGCKISCNMHPVCSTLLFSVDQELALDIKKAAQVSNNPCTLPRAHAQFACL